MRVTEGRGIARSVLSNRLESDCVGPSARRNIDEGVGGMTMPDAVIEHTLREFCATGDMETAKTRISIWMAVEHTGGMTDALRDAAKAWRGGRPSLVGRWLNARADKVSAGAL